MNFIAHLVLSPKEKHYLSGNIAADFLRGYDQKRISDPIRSGIGMHQFVDQYTDTHPIFKKSKDKLKEHFHLLSGILVDVFYDHFLAKNFEKIVNVSLQDFCGYIYGVLDQNLTELPPGLQRFVPVMIRENVLHSYHEMKGIQMAITRINRIIRKNIEAGLAITALQDHYESFEADFMDFFPYVIKATESYRNGYDSFLLPEILNHHDKEVFHG